MGTLVYTDPESGFPLAVMDATTLTMKRTGAAAAVATDHLAVEDATSLGIIGAGVQSYTQLEAISQVRPIESVIVSDLDDDRVQRFIDTFGDEFDVRAGTISEAARVTSCRRSRRSKTPSSRLRPRGAHPRQRDGCRRRGKHELATEVIRDATLVIDDFDQTTHSGEINVP